MLDPSGSFIGRKKKQNGQCQWEFYWWKEETKWSMPVGVLLRGWGERRNKMVNPSGSFIEGVGGKKKQNGQSQWEFYWRKEETKWSLPVGFFYGGGGGRNKMVNASGSFIGGKKKQNGHCQWGFYWGEGGKKKQNGILHGAERSKMITSDGTKRSLLGLKETKWSFHMMGQK